MVRLFIARIFQSVASERWLRLETDFTSAKKNLLYCTLAFRKLSLLQTY